jgi:peptidyl-tRNA hydrolase, PTH1 family
MISRIRSWFNRPQSIAPGNGLTDNRGGDNPNIDEDTEQMRMVVGLGNPGREYVGTRHNIGFLVVDELVRRHGPSNWKKRFRSEVAEVFIDGRKIVLIKPQTYMNLSGTAVRETLNWYHLDHDELLVVLDDLDTPFASLRLREKGSAGGHNGLSSIIQSLGSSEIPRLKIGIGRGPSTASAHVLSRFTPEQERDLPELIQRATDAVEIWIKDGIVPAMNQANQKVAAPAPVNAANTARPV